MSTWDALLPPCPSGKATFLTASEAERALTLIVARATARGETRYPQRAYQCPDCLLWHLTAQRTEASA